MLPTAPRHDVRTRVASNTRHARLRAGRPRGSNPHRQQGGTALFGNLKLENLEKLYNDELEDAYDFEH